MLITLESLSCLRGETHRQGLQVLKDGSWVFVEPIHGAIVVNTGHITEVRMCHISPDSIKKI
jgi:isopenicillin N synthase-like dioxygenase